LESEIYIFRNAALEVYIIVYVDDIRIAAKTTSIIYSIVVKLSEAFNL